MSEIKPVGYISRVMCVGPDYGKEIFGKLAVQSLQAGYYSHQKLYDQSAIDRLTAERDDALAAADFLEVEMAKFQIEADTAKAERDAAVADAQQLRDFSDVDKNVLIAAAKRARRCMAWACDQRPEFNAEYEALDKAIAAMKEHGQGK